MRFSIPPPMLTMRTLSVLISRFLFSRSRFLRVFCVAEFCVCPYNRAQNVTRWGEMITRENERSDESSFFFFLSSFALVWLKKNLTFPLSSVVLKSGHKKQNLVVSAQESSQEEISASRFFSLSFSFFFVFVTSEEILSRQRQTPPMKNVLFWETSFRFAPKKNTNTSVFKRETNKRERRASFILRFRRYARYVRDVIRAAEIICCPPFILLRRFALSLLLFGRLHRVFRFRATKRDFFTIV